MLYPVKYPALLFALSFVVMCLSAQAGLFLRRRWLRPEDGTDEDFGLIVSATLTLLGLIIGFSFSMAVGRYDQRKNYEEEEANAIGTEYLRAGLLPAADAVKVRALLKSYLDERILFYKTRDQDELLRTNAATAQLQNELWAAVSTSAGAQPTPVTALAVAGMNDVLNSQGYTQAAWWNQIPPGAWGLMAAVAVFSNLLVGYVSHGAKVGVVRLMLLPFVLCIAFFAIADIDSPRRGVIQVHPQNLISLAQSLQGSGQ